MTRNLRSSTRNQKPLPQETNDQTEEQELAEDEENVTDTEFGDEVDHQPVHDDNQNTGRVNSRKERLYPDLPEENFENESAKASNNHSEKKGSSCSTVAFPIILLIFAVLAATFYAPERFDLFVDDISTKLASVFSFSNAPKFTPESESDESNRWQIFDKTFDEKIFPKYRDIVPKLGWDVIRASLKDVLLKDRKWDKQAPSVILILGKENDKNVSCFARDLGRAVSESFHEDDPLHVDASKATLETMVGQFNQYFGPLKRHTIVVDGLNKLAGNAALSLHRFTDHEDSIYTDAVILLVGYTDAVGRLQYDSKSLEMDELASEMLEKSWIKSLSEDKIASLVSRLTPSVTAVLHDNKATATVC